MLAPSPTNVVAVIIPAILTSPTTCSFEVGIIVPIPTEPPRPVGPGPDVIVITG